VKPLTRADREFLFLAASFMVYGLGALVASLVVGDHVAIVVAAAAVSGPVFALAAGAVTPSQTERFLDHAAPAPPGAPRESARGQLVRFTLASLLLAAPLALASVIGLVVLFDRASEPFGALVEGLAAGVFLGFGLGYLRLSLWMKRWEAETGKLVWREAWPRRRQRDGDALPQRSRSLIVRYYLTAG
jgi:hypothetical protein